MCALVQFEEKDKKCDGFILLNTMDPYDGPPLKCKDHVTCDFLLESAAYSNAGTFVILAEKQERSQSHAGLSSRSSQPRQGWGGAP